jgi:BASS family bile acid:Na+ symporter
MATVKIAAAILLIALTFNAGLQLDRQRLLAAFKDVSLLLRVTLANFIIVPILGILVEKVFRLPPGVATGFMLMAICAGVPFTVLSIRERGGRFNVAAALALYLPILSLVFVPLMASWVLPLAADAHLPMLRFFVTLLLLQVLPATIGILIASSSLQGAVPILERISRIGALVMLGVLVIFSSPDLARSIAMLYGTLDLLAAAVLTILALVTGWLLGGAHTEDRRTVASATALRNVGLSMLIATTSFAADHDTSAAVLTYFFIQVVVTTIVGVYWARKTRRAMA